LEETAHDTFIATERFFLPLLFALTELCFPAAWLYPDLCMPQNPGIQSNEIDACVLRKPIMAATLEIEDVQIAGHAQRIALRVYRPLRAARLLPIVLYFHGGGFTRGNLDDADVAARYLAEHTVALVVSVGYSLAPRFPFPNALEDGYLAAKWAIENAHRYRADARRLGVAGHDAGGNLATCLSMMARDRGDFAFAAQALLAPLLDPSMTRLGEAQTLTAELERSDCAQCYRAYLPTVAQRLHPYAAPIESRRLAGLPPIFIASAEHDILHVEAERYAAALIAAGVHTQITRHRNASHYVLAAHPPALEDMAIFFKRQLADATPDNN
jgi:acetyl esterase